MKYDYSKEYTQKCRELCDKLCLDHVDKDRISVIISKGTKTRRVIARIHTLSKSLQLGMNERPFYVIELITEKFFKANEEEQTKTLIHELLHIPHNFGGGFRHHKPHVNNRTVEEHYKKLKETENQEDLEVAPEKLH